MEISNKNPEGYSDPTPAEAIRNILTERAERQSFRPLACICSPYRGDTETNTRNARRYCRFAVESGYIPIAPHLFFPQFMNEKTERETALFMNFVLLGKCHELWVFGETVTDGMKAEISRAEKKNMAIKYFDAKEGFWNA